MKRHFLFIVILDKQVNAFFKKLLNFAKSEKQIKLPIHITIRGPYKSSISPKTIESCKQELKSNILKISNVGRFSNENEEVVYLNVDSTNLREVWYKPDFPIFKSGYSPHISIYRGKNKQWADRLEQLLKNIEILTGDFKVVEVGPDKPAPEYYLNNANFNFLKNAKWIKKDLVNLLDHPWHPIEEQHSLNLALTTQA